MGNPEDKERHYRRRKKNMYAKILRNGDNKGAFSIKVVNPKKGGEYKRDKIDIRSLGVEEDE